MAPTRKEKRKAERKAKAKEGVLSMMTESPFNWIAFRAKNFHSLTKSEIESAFWDPRRLTLEVSRRNRAGVVYAADGRRRIVARAGPSGGLLHIAYTLEDGKIKVFHARPATPREKKRYDGK